MTVAGQSAYFVGVSISAKTHIIHPVTCLNDTEVQPNVISKDFLPVVWLSKISEGAQPLPLSSSKYQFKTKCNTTLHIRIGRLPTGVLFTEVEYLAVGVPIVTKFMNEYILAIRPRESKVIV